MFGACQDVLMKAKGDSRARAALLQQQDRADAQPGTYRWFWSR